MDTEDMRSLDESELDFVSGGRGTICPEAESE